MTMRAAAVVIALFNFGQTACSHTISKLYWTTHRDTVIQRANLDGSEPEWLYRTPGGGIPDIAFDSQGSRLYFQSTEAGGIERSDMNGRNASLAISISQYLTVVSVDSFHQKIYWSGRGEEGNAIWRSSFDGSERELLFDRLPRVTGIEIDPLKGYFYWADFFTGAIRRTALDTSRNDIIFDLNTFGRTPWPEALAIDAAAGYLYAADVAFQSIIRMRLDGSDPTMLVTEGVINPEAIALDPLGGRLYWSNNWGRSDESPEYFQYIMSAKLDGTDVRKEFVPTDGYGYPAAAYHLAIVQVPVPEPATVTMTAICLAFCFCNLVATRRRPTANAKFMKQDGA